LPDEVEDRDYETKKEGSSSLSRVLRRSLEAPRGCYLCVALVESRQMTRTRELDLEDYFVQLTDKNRQK